MHCLTSLPVRVASNILLSPRLLLQNSPNKSCLDHLNQAIGTVGPKEKRTRTKTDCSSARTVMGQNDIMKICHLETQYPKTAKHVIKWIQSADSRHTYPL
jgi:hypothetical protein